jgi:hypothetical protein
LGHNPGECTRDEKGNEEGVRQKKGEGIMKPICIQCQRFYKLVKSGISFIEAMPRVDGAKPGKYNSEHWTPYKLWLADKWQCPGCLHEIIHDVGQKPVSEHYEDDFEATVKLYKPIVTVNDC